MRWCCENDVEITVHKSAVIQFGPFSTSYRIDGCGIPIFDYLRDLGVLMTADLDFSRHVHDICKSARCLINTAFRCFAIKDASVYIRLHKSIVL